MERGSGGMDRTGGGWGEGKHVRRTHARGMHLYPLYEQLGWPAGERTHQSKPRGRCGVRREQSMRSIVLAGRRWHRWCTRCTRCRRQQRADGVANSHLEVTCVDSARLPSPVEDHEAEPHGLAHSSSGKLAKDLAAHRCRLRRGQEHDGAREPVVGISKSAVGTHGGLPHVQGLGPKRQAEW